MRFSTTQKTTTLALLLVFGMFIASTDAHCHRFKHKGDHDMDWDMDRDWDMDKDFDMDFDWDMDKDHDDWDWDMDMDWDMDKDFDMDSDFDFDDCDYDSDDMDGEKTYGPGDKDMDKDADEGDNDGPNKPSGTCDTDSDCENPLTPFCGAEGEGEKKCRGCNFFFEGTDKTAANAKCVAYNADKPICFPNGHCGKDQTENKNRSEEIKGKPVELDKLDEELGDLADAAFDGELASDDTEEIMDNLMSSFAASTENVQSKDDIKNFAASLRNVTKNKDHFNGEGAKKAREVIQDVLSKAKDLDGGFADTETRDNIGNSLSDAISGAKEGLSQAEKKAELGKADENMRDFARISARALAVGEDVVVTTDECEVKVKRVNPSELADQTCDPATDSTCVKFPAVIADSVTDCSGVIDIEFMKKAYNANESDDGTFATSENSTEINLNCATVGSSDTTTLNVSGLANPLTFSIALEDGQTPAEGEVCKFWDEDNSTWSSEGCTSEVKTDVCECSCNHLTEFSVAYASEADGDQEEEPEEDEEKEEDEASSASALFVMPFVAILAIFSL